MSQSNYSSQQLNNYPSDVNASSREISAIDYKQVIHLIKSILGLEYCVQYQVVPLTIKQGCLILGMVNPEDQAALNFVRPIAKALSYGLTIQGIDSYTHQLILAEYLKRNYASAQPNKPDKDNNSEQTIAEIAPQPSSKGISDSAMTITEIPFEPKKTNQENKLDDKPTLIVDRLEDSFGIPGAKIKASLDDDQPTIYASLENDLVEVDTPSKPNHRSEGTNNQGLTYTQTDEFSHEVHLPLTQMPGHSPSTGQNYLVKDSSPGNESASSQYNSEQVLDVKAERIPELVQSKSSQHLEQGKTPVRESSSDFNISTSSSNSNLTKSKKASEGQSLPCDGRSPRLEKDGVPLTREALSILSPRQLWQELLIKILDGGIGRLYLERNRDRGRIIWSQDGVVQSTLDNVSLAILQALINEVKTLARVPLEQLKKPKKVAIEKHYQQERLLLRIEMFPGEWGDDITIQVLRGKALKFYEQKQMKKMTEQALNLAQKLEKTLTKMRVCFDSAEIGDLSELQKVQQEINHQLKLLDQ